MDRRYGAKPLLGSLGSATAKGGDPRYCLSMTHVCAIRSPKRWPPLLDMTAVKPVSGSTYGKPSTNQPSERRQAAEVVQGRPSASTTRRPAAALPGVTPVAPWTRPCSTSQKATAAVTPTSRPAAVPSRARASRKVTTSTTVPMAASTAQAPHRFHSTSVGSTTR